MKWMIEKGGERNPIGAEFERKTFGVEFDPNNKQNLFTLPIWRWSGATSATVLETPSIMPFQVQNVERAALKGH